MYAGPDGSTDCAESHDTDPQRGSRRQYTVKGIETKTVDLMRDAARKEGMKIGSWISLRMREAAQKALANEAATLRQGSNRVPSLALEEATALYRQLVMVMDSYRESTDDRLVRIERELHEITRTQRTIMASILSSHNMPQPNNAAGE